MFKRPIQCVGRLHCSCTSAHLCAILLEVEAEICIIVFDTFLGGRQLFVAEQAHVLHATASALILAPVRVIPLFVPGFALDGHFFRSYLRLVAHTRPAFQRRARAIRIWLVVSAWRT